MATTVRIPSSRRRWPVFAIAVVVAGFIVLSFLSNFYVDILWYREVGLSQVFWTRILAQAGLAAAFFITFFALLLVNLYVTRRLAPTVVALTPEQEIVERFRENIEPYLRWALPLGAAVLALFVGLAASGHWQEFLLWRSSGGIGFGDPEEVFGRDPAFYVFSLPWLKYLQGWLFGALVGVTVIAGIGHFLQGGIRPQAVGLSDKVDPQVRAHLSVLLGLVLLAKAWGYWLGRFDLLTSERGVVHGASYTDVNAQLPALTFLAIVAVICAVLFFVNARYRVWSLPIIAVGLLLLVSILLGTAYPAFIQQFRVSPNEQQYELPYHRAKHRWDAARFRSRRHPLGGTSVRAEGQRRRRSCERGDDREHPVVAAVGPEGELPDRAADPAVLRVRRRRRRPLRDRRAEAGPDGLRPRSQPGGHQRGCSDMAEPAPRLYAWVRCRRGAGELDHR